MNTTTFNTNVSDEVVLNALLYLDERYVDGQHIDLPGFMMDNGIHMSATMLHRLCDYGVLTVAHDGINVDQEVPEFSYVYHGVDDRFCAGLSAKRMIKDFLVNAPKVASLAKTLYYYTFVNADVSVDGIFDTLDAYWSVWSDFFPDWKMTVENRILWGNPSYVAACSPLQKHIVWFADPEEVRQYASQLGMHWQTYIRVAMAHELGHASDVSLKDAALLGDVTLHVSESTIMFERHAWANGRAFVPDSELAAYERLNRRNIQIYTKNMKEHNKMFGLAMDETSMAGNTTKEECPMNVATPTNVLVSPATGETPVAENKTTKGEVKMSTLDIKSITSGKKEDPMHLTQFEDAMNYVMKQPGFKGTSKVKEALLVATQEDPNNLIAFLRNPEDFGIAKASITKYITPILDAVKLPKKKFSRARFDQVLVLEAHFDSYELSEDGKTVTLDAVYGRRSESLLLKTAAGLNQIKVTRRTSLGHDEDVYMWDARNILYVSSSEESAEIYGEVLNGNLKLLIREPLAPKDDYVNYEQAIRSASNRRLMQGTFVKAGTEEFDARITLLDEIGGHPSTLGKKVDASKDRSSLSASNSIGTGLFMGREIVDAPEIHEGAYYVKGGDITILVAKDVKSIVRQGKYFVIDKDTKQLVLHDASVEGQEVIQEVTDGMAMAGERIKTIFDAYAGKPTAGGQFRLAPANKGFMVFVPFLERYFPGVDLVLFESTVKVDIKGFLEACPEYNAELRFMNFAAKKSSKNIELSYQAVHTTSLSAKQALDIATPEFDKYSNVAFDPSSLLSLLNKDGQVEHHTILDKFLSASKLAAKDPYILQSSVNSAKEALDRLKTGKLPIEGEFKFMLSDVFAIIDAMLSGTFVVEEGKGLKPGTAFTLRNGKIMVAGVEFATNRFPAVTLGEGAGVVSPEHEDLDARYIEAVELGQGYFENIICYSAHDFMAQKQGGADHDGDKSVVIFHELYVKAVFNIQEKFPPVLDFTIVDGVMVAGCQWEEEIKIPSVMGTPGIISQDGYKLEVSEWTPEAVRAFLKLQDFYDSLTLKPNRIGEFTDYSTYLHDALRVVLAELAIAHKSGDASAMTKLTEEKDLLIKWMAYLRLVQGYEIDRAKKGGAFEEALKDELSFIKNPRSLSYRLGKWVETEKGKYFQWGRPVWMKNGHGNFKNNSVMAALYSNVIDRIAKLNVDANLEMKRLEKENVVLSAFNGTIEFNEDHFKKLYTPIVRRKTSYNAELKEIILLEENMRAEQEGILTEQQEKDLTAERMLVFEKYTQQMHELYENASKVGITKAQFGFYVYKAVNTKSHAAAEEKSVTGKSFTFRAAAEYIYDAFMQAEDKKARGDYFTAFKGRRVSVRAYRLSNAGVLSERTQGQVAKLEVIDGETFISFENGVRVQVLGDYLDKVAGYTGDVKVEQVILPTNKAKASSKIVGLGIVLG